MPEGRRDLFPGIIASFSPVRTSKAFALQAAGLPTSSIPPARPSQPRACRCDLRTERNYRHNRRPSEVPPPSSPLEHAGTKILPIRDFLADRARRTSKRRPYLPSLRETVKRSGSSKPISQTDKMRVPLLF